MNESTFGKKNVYHGELVRATSDGPLAILITGEPQESKFKGKPPFIGFKMGEEEHTLAIENDTIREKLTGLRGHIIDITATGTRDDADVDIYDTGERGGSGKTQQQRPGRFERKQQQAVDRSPARQPADRGNQRQPDGKHVPIFGATAGMAVNNAVKVIAESMAGADDALANYYLTPQFPKDVWEIASDLARVSLMIEDGKLAPTAKQRAGDDKQPDGKRKPDPEPDRQQPRQPSMQEMEEMPDVPF